MFFIQKWQHYLHKYSVEKWIKDHNLQFASEIVDEIFTGKDEVSSKYNVLDRYYKNAPTTLVQRLNRIWFIILFFLFIAPVRYIMTGNKGFDERTESGKWITKLIGEEKVHKAWGYKGGWQKTLSKEEFLTVLLLNNVKTSDDFIRFIFNDEEDRFCNYLIFENKNYIYNTQRQRFNEFWVYPILVPIVLVLKLIGYIRGKDIDYSDKYKKILSRLIGEN